MRLLRAADHRRMSWKNGGGETIEVAVHPAEAGLAAFGWRISMAVVAGDGPFSTFPGIDRTLCVLEGEGMALEIDGRPHRVTRHSAPLAFPADVPAAARLLGGPVTDLNVMTRRGAYGHALTRIAADPDATLSLAGRWVVVVAGGACRLVAEGGGVALGARDAILFDGPLLARVRAEGGPALLYAATITAEQLRPRAVEPVAGGFSAPTDPHPAAPCPD